MPRDAYVDALLPVGLALYAAGEAGNLYHHAARADAPAAQAQATMLRGMSALALAATPPPAEALAAAPEPPKSACSVPHGGLFGVVAMPHYFFGLPRLGVALVAQQLNALLVFGGMVAPGRPRRRARAGGTAPSLRRVAGGAAALGAVCVLTCVSVRQPIFI